MSRPHDGQRPFLPYGNPFRMIFPKRFYLSPQLAAILGSFEQKLAEGLKKLKPKDTLDIWSLSWLSEAVNFMSDTNNSIKNLITDLELPVSDWEDKWIDAYLDSSVKLLDICIALSSELSRLDQGQVLLQYVLHQLALSSNDHSYENTKRVQATLSDWRQLIDSRNPKLDDCCVALQSLAGSLYSTKVGKSAKGKVLAWALYAVKVVTIFVCSVFTSALCGCTKPLITLVVSNKFSWAEAFNDLQADVLKCITSQVSSEKVIVLKELGAVENCVKRLVSLNGFIGQKDGEVLEQSGSASDNEIVECSGDRNTIGQESVLELAEASDRLSHGLDSLSEQVGGFFQIVSQGRNALLCNLGASDEAQMQDMVGADERL